MWDEISLVYTDPLPLLLNWPETVGISFTPYWVEFGGEDLGGGEEREGRTRGGEEREGRKRGGEEREGRG